MFIVPHKCVVLFFMATHCGVYWVLFGGLSLRPSLMDLDRKNLVWKIGSGIQAWHCILDVKGGVKSRNKIAEYIFN